MSLVPSRSIQLCSARETLLGNWRRSRFLTGATVSQALDPPSSSEARKTCAQPEARKHSSACVEPVLPSAFFLTTSCCKQQHSAADFLLRVNDLDVRHVNPLQEQHDLA